jgi:hypothetical protein
MHRLLSAAVARLKFTIARGQDPAGIITGVISDATGAVIPGAAVRMLPLPAGIGNLGRYPIRPPAGSNINLSVNRRFKLSEKASVQLRADAFNLRNQTCLGYPAIFLGVVADKQVAKGVCHDPDCGLITSARSSRFLQLAAGLDF